MTPAGPSDPQRAVRVVFLGTPEVAVPALEALVVARDVDLVAVVTNPDRPRGRSGDPVAPPVKQAAARHGLPVLQPRRPRDAADELAALDVDVAAVVAYGALLPRDVLELARLGFVNLHFSLLPRWRGAAPVQHAIRAGDEVTGLTTFVLDEGMDTGPILHQQEVPIGPNETAGSLMDRLAAVGAPLLARSVVALARGAEPRPQPDDGVTMAPKIAVEDATIDWTQPAAQTADVVRAFNPRPGAHTRFRGRRLKVWLAAPVALDDRVEPGHVAAVGGDGVVVATGDGGLRLVEVQPEGRARMDGRAFANGYQPVVGAPLDA